MEDIKTKLMDEELEQVSGGGGAIHNKGDIWCPDMIIANGAIYGTKPYDGHQNPDPWKPCGNHESK